MTTLYMGLQNAKYMDMPSSSPNVYEYARRCDKYLYQRPRTSTKTYTTTVTVYHYFL